MSRSALDVPENKQVIHILKELLETRSMEEPLIEAIKEELLKFSENRGNQARDHGHWARAAKEYHRVVRINPHHFDIWIQYGHALKENGDYPNAEQAYRQAIKLRPKDAEAHLQLGHLLKVSSRQEEALESYRLAQTLDPSFCLARGETKHLELQILVSQQRRPEQGASLLSEKWQITYDSILPFIVPEDILLLPHASWPPFHCTTRYYDTNINLDDATILVLNKVYKRNLGRKTLSRIYEEWQVIFANDVFAVFATKRDGAPDVNHSIEQSRHLKTIENYLRSPEQKRRKSTIFFCHLPKSGGTSLWCWLANVFPSHLYYKGRKSFKARPPEPGEFDLVGGHYPFSLLEQSLHPGDLVFSMMRDPTERFFSLVAHSRRQDMDPNTLGETMRAMRDLPLRDFLRTQAGREEAIKQLYMFGGMPDSQNNEEDMLHRAEKMLERQDCLIAPAHESAAFAKLLAQRLEFTAHSLPRFNINKSADYARYRKEFEEVREELEVLNAMERRLFESVCRRFCTMLTQQPMADEKWQATYDSIVPYIVPEDVLLAPQASWPPFNCTTRYYETDIHLGDATLLVLNKTYQRNLGRETLSKIFDEWQAIFANDVFVVFATKRDGAPEVKNTVNECHLKPIEHYLRSNEQKCRKPTIFFCHVPKSGGTSLWTMLSNVFPSNLYYKDPETFKAWPPKQGEFDLVGGHYPFGLLERALNPGDLVFSMMRDPTERFFSSLVHCRRQHLDPKVLNPSSLALREMRLKDFLHTPEGHEEIIKQLYFFGWMPDANNDEEALFCRAEKVLEREDCLIVPSRESATLAQLLAQRLEFTPSSLPRLNTNTSQDYARCCDEFEEAREELEKLNAMERRLYESVCRRFLLLDS